MVKIKVFLWKTKIGVIPCFPWQTDKCVRVLKSSPYLHLWTLIKPVMKIHMFGQIKMYLLAWSSSWSLLLYWQTAAVSRKLGFEPAGSWYLSGHATGCVPGFINHCLPSAVESRLLACLPSFPRIFRGLRSIQQWQFCHPVSDFITDANLGDCKHTGNIWIWLIFLGM